jgi:signal transduction histidine kinase
MTGSGVIDGPEQHWLRGLANAIQGGVVITDSEGIPEYMSQTARYLLGGCPGVVSAEEIWRPVHERIQSARASSIDSMNVARVLDLQLETGGADIDLRVEVMPLDPDELGYLAILRSRRELRAIESDLRLADRMRGIMILYRTMVHDLKAPLNVIVISLDSLYRSLTERKGDDADREARQLRDLRRLQSELTRLQRSLQAYLDQTSGDEVGQTSFDFRRLTREVTVLLRPQARTQSVDIATRITEQPVNVFGYRDRLKQVVFNVAMNALEALSNGGTLSFELDVDEANMVLRVRDDGPGIDQELINRVFEMHMTTKPDGSGIGLFVARATLVDHGGSIRLESEPGEGTTAVIQLPLVHDVGGEQSADRSAR